jgi:hypothetical protein
VSTVDGGRSSEGEVIALGAEPVEGHGQAPVPSGPASRLHGIAIAGMAISALAGTASMLAFATVHWTGAAAHYVIGAVVLSAVAFLACASAAVFTAARDTYARPRD